MSYTVTVTRVNEAEHKPSEETYADVLSANVTEEGSLKIQREDGKYSSFGATT